MSEKLSTPEVEINVSGDKQEVLYSLISTEIKRIKRIMLNNAKFREALFYPIEFNLFLGQETKDTIEEAKRIIKLVMSWY
ncbi:MAG: hypothetical protein LBC61_04360 [Candidatus Peribacteria bacterium]|jgi:hypothetical protein|nr:hypothetical protein [Candidatus Peribacteria bacterium]